MTEGQNEAAWFLGGAFPAVPRSLASQENPYVSFRQTRANWVLKVIVIRVRVCLVFGLVIGFGFGLLLGFVLGLVLLVVLLGFRQLLDRGGQDGDGRVLAVLAVACRVLQRDIHWDLELLPNGLVDRDGHLDDLVQTLRLALFACGGAFAGTLSERRTGARRR